MPRDVLMSGEQGVVGLCKYGSFEFCYSCSLLGAAREGNRHAGYVSLSY